MIGNEDTAVRVRSSCTRTPQSWRSWTFELGTSLAAARVYGGGATPTAMISPSASSPDLWDQSLRVPGVPERIYSTGPSSRALPGRRSAPGEPASSTSTTTMGGACAGRSRPSLRGWAGPCSKPIPTSRPLPSLEPYLSRMRRGGADVLLLAAERPGAELALREMRSLGCGGPCSAGTRSRDRGGRGARGGIRLSFRYLADRRDDRNVAFVADYARAFRTAPDHRGAGAYDIVLLLARVWTRRAPTGEPFGTTSRAWVGASRRSRRDRHDRVRRQGGRGGQDGVIGVVRNGPAGDGGGA